MKEQELKAVDVVKDIICHFFFAFIFVFICLFVNQLLLLMKVFTEGQLTFFQKIMLILYSIPSVILMGTPFAVCIGFVQGLIKINITDKLKNGKDAFMKKISIPVFSLSLIISLFCFIVSDYVLPNANVAFSNLYRTASIKDNGERSVIFPDNGPRNTSSKMVLQRIKNIHSEKELNVWILELNKKYSIPLGALFFSFFAMSLSFLIKNKKIIGFCISLFSCILYWAILMYGQIFSIRSGKYGVLVMWLPNIIFLCITFVLYLCYKRINAPPASMRAANVKGFNGT